MVESSDTDLNHLLMLGVDGVVLLLLDVEGLGCLGVLAAILGWLPEGLFIFRGFLVEFIVARFCLFIGGILAVLFWLVFIALCLALSVEGVISLRVGLALAVVSYWLVLSTVSCLMTISSRQIGASCL